MHFVTVPSIPNVVKTCDCDYASVYIEKFHESDSKCVRVDYTPFEYTNQMSAYNAIRRIIKELKFPMRVVARGNNIYIYKTI